MLCDMPMRSEGNHERRRCHGLAICDGRVTVVVGNATRHVTTADEHVYPQGTALHHGVGMNRRSMAACVIGIGSATATSSGNLIKWAAPQRFDVFRGCADELRVD